jgi:hypothetical protein
LILPPCPPHREPLPPIILKFIWHLQKGYPAMRLMLCNSSHYETSTRKLVVSVRFNYLHHPAIVDTTKVLQNQVRKSYCKAIRTSAELNRGCIAD